MTDDVLVNKAASLERCVMRIREEYGSSSSNLTDNQTKQDSIILNIERACSAAIDGAMHVVKERRLGIPQQSRDAFHSLAEAGLMPSALAEKMKKMVGFRNIAVHEYQQLNLAIVQQVVEHHLSDFDDMARWMINLA